MARTAVHVAIVAVLLTQFVGCTRFRRPLKPAVVSLRSADQAPTFELLPGPKSVISTVSDRAAPNVTFVDSRPDVERLYFPGNDDAHHWRDAITVLPMESFQPDLKEMLQKCLVENLSDVEKYDAVSCEMTSFQVALDERGRGEEDLLYGYKEWDDSRVKREAAERKQQQQEEKARRERSRLGHEDEDKSMADAVIGIIFLAAVVEPVKKKFTRDTKSEKLTSYPQSIPVALSEGHRHGWNCRIAMRVKVVSADAESYETPLSVVIHRPKEVAVPVKAQIQRVVNDAIEELGEQVRSIGVATEQPS